MLYRIDCEMCKGLIRAFDVNGNKIKFDNLNIEGVNNCTCRDISKLSEQINKIQLEALNDKVGRFYYKIGVKGGIKRG